MRSSRSRAYGQILPTPRGSILPLPRPSQMPYNKKTSFFKKTAIYIYVEDLVSAVHAGFLHPLGRSLLLCRHLHKTLVEALVLHHCLLQMLLHRDLLLKLLHGLSLLCKCVWPTELAQQDSDLSSTRGPAQAHATIACSNLVQGAVQYNASS